MYYIQAADHQAILCSNGAVAALAPLLQADIYKVIPSTYLCEVHAVENYLSIFWCALIYLYYYYHGDIAYINLNNCF